jgi:hypothetical protein
MSCFTLCQERPPISFMFMALRCLKRAVGMDKTLAWPGY